MPTTLNFQLKQAMEALTSQHRWDVLTVLILHTNRANRTWVSISTIARMATNKNRNLATKARDWLVEHGAIEIVPFDKRFGKDEEELPPRQIIYQLTGVVNIDGAEIPYLYFGEPESITNDTFESITNDNIKSDTRTMSNGSKSNGKASNKKTNIKTPKIGKEENQRRFGLGSVFVQYITGRKDVTPREIAAWRGRGDSGVIGLLAEAYPDLSVERFEEFLCHHKENVPDEKFRMKAFDKINSELATWLVDNPQEGDIMASDAWTEEHQIYLDRGYGHSVQDVMGTPLAEIRTVLKYDEGR